VSEYLYVLDFGVLIFEGTPAGVAASPLVRAAYLGSEAEGLGDLEETRLGHELAAAEEGL